MPLISLPEGTIAFQEEFSLIQVMQLIEGTARWVAPETFNLLPVWYPEHARKAPLYKENWKEPQTNTSRKTGVSTPKFEGNTHANKALTKALGLRSKGREGWSCCHLWGIDDQKYQKSNVVVQDPCFFSCVANMVLLPAPLKAFTDIMPEVKAMLRICARNTYNWHCDHIEMTKINTKLDAWNDWSKYPSSWPREPETTQPKGTIPINSDIQKRAERRWHNIQRDMENPGPHYPKESVREVLCYWGLDLASPLEEARKNQ
jgi:hypothetical protein